MNKWIYITVAGVVAVVVGATAVNSMSKVDHGDSTAKNTSKSVKSSYSSSSKISESISSDGSESSVTSEISTTPETSATSVSVDSANNLELTEQSAIELFKKMFTVNPTLAYDVLWENYRDNAWRVETQGPGEIVLHYTNIGAGGSYYKFENLTDNRVKITVFGGNASYPDDPTHAYVVDEESGKLLGAGVKG